MEAGEGDGFAVGGGEAEGRGHGDAGEGEVAEVVLRAGSVGIVGGSDGDVAGEGFAGVGVAVEGGEGSTVEVEGGAEFGVVEDGGLEGGVGFGELAGCGLVVVEVEEGGAVEEFGVGLVGGEGGEAFELAGGEDGLLPSAGAEGEGGDALEALGAGVAGGGSGGLPEVDLGWGVGCGTGGFHGPAGGEIGFE